GALHMQEYGTVLVTAESDITAILRNSRADPRIEELLDRHDQFLVGFVIKLAAFGSVLLTFARAHDRLARHEMLHDRAKNGRLQVLPVGSVLGNRHEIVAEENADHAGYFEQTSGKGRGRPGSFGVAEIRRAFLQHHPSRQELQ